MLNRWIILCLTIMFVLTACNSPVYNQTENNVADVVIKTKKARKKFDDTGKPDPALVVKQGLYVDTTPISLERQPSWLTNHVVIRGDQLPFSYYSRTIGNGAGSNVLTKYQTGLDPAVNVSMNYSGTVKGALDLLATKTGYVYSIRGNSIYWQAFITRTYDIAFMPGGTDYLMGKSSSGGGGNVGGAVSGGPSGGTVANYVSSDSSDSEYSNLKGTLSIWKDLDATIKQLLSADGKSIVSESTTSVTIRDRPTNVELVGKYISNLNRSLSKQVLVKVQVLQVNLENDYDFGVNWQMIAKAFNKSPFVVNANYGTPISITALSPQSTVAGKSLTTPQYGVDQSQNPTANGGPAGLPSYTILLTALNQQGKTSVVSEPRVLCLNNQVSVVRIVNSEGYVASIQNTTFGGTSGNSTTQNNVSNQVTSQITPGTVVTGLTLYILPKILKDNIYLQVNADLSTLNSLQLFGAANIASATNAVQLPNITAKHFNQRSMIRSGDTLILAGFRQISNTANAMQFLNSQALGGKGSQQVVQETIVLITPIILNGSA